MPYTKTRRLLDSTEAQFDCTFDRPTSRPNMTSSASLGPWFFYHIVEIANVEQQVWDAQVRQERT